MSKKITIIGAGIAGLSAGCYARMNGFEAEIFESHNIPGGLCTSWKRGDYIIDGCLDWLAGSNPKNDFYHFWQEVDAFDDEQIVNHEILYIIEGENDRQLLVYADIDRFEKHLLELSPDDEIPTRQLCGLVRKVMKISMPIDKPAEFYNFFDIIKMMVKFMPVMKVSKKLNNASVKEFADTFKEPLMRKFLKEVFGTSEYSLFHFVFGMGILFSGSGGYPLGGSLEFAKRIENRYKNLGGVIHYNSKVERVLVEDNKAVGLRLTEGSEHKSDYVISGADLHATLYSMLDGKYIDPDHEYLFKEVPLAPSCVQVSLGVNMDLTNEPACIQATFPTSEPILIGNTRYTDISVRNYANDQTIAPKGKTVLVSRYLMNEYEYWKKLNADKDAYAKKKDEILQFTIRQLERKYPGIRDVVEVADVCTPMTYQRYANTWKGAYMTWVNTTKNGKKLMQIKKTVPGLENFWLSGMWVMAPGGVPTGLKTSRDIVQIICKKEKQKFVTTTA